MKRLVKPSPITAFVALCLHVAAASGLHAQELLAAEEAAFRQAVERAAASVVPIETFGGGGAAAAELIAEGPTTGTIIDEAGWIITSLFSFREQPASILVTLPGGKRAAAQIIARDHSRELALLKVDASNLPTAEFVPKDELQVGQWAIALGKTYDTRLVSQSVGIISALGRAYDKAVQTDAKVSPINYGGPLIDLSGRVIGILTPLSPGSFLEGESTQLYDSGIGFAIPLQEIMARFPRMRQGEDIHPGKLGIVSIDQNELGGPVILSGAAPGSPAAKAGLAEGDVIVEAQGQPIRLLAHLRHALGNVDAGETFEFTIRRGAERRQLQCTLAEEIPVYRRRYLGLRLRSLAEADEAAQLEIAAIEADSPAAETSLEAGQKILAIGDQSRPTLEDMRRKIAVAELDEPLQLHVRGPEDASPLSVAILPGLWPSEIAAGLPQIDGSVDQQAEASATELTLGDFPNKTYVIAAPQSPDRQLGLLIIFPEPGELERTKTLESWGAFCRDYGWLVVVVNSGQPQAWSQEEVELAGRVLGKIENAYPLDKSRIVIGGLGIGGRMALLSAASQAERIAAVLTMGAKVGRLSLRQANMPLQSLDFLLAGDRESLEKAAATLRESGYSAMTLDAPNFKANQWESLPLDAIQRWLEGLGRF